MNFRFEYFTYASEHLNIHISEYVPQTPHAHFTQSDREERDTPQVVNNLLCIKGIVEVILFPEAYVIQVRRGKAFEWNMVCDEIMKVLRIHYGLSETIYELPTFMSGQKGARKEIPTDTHIFPPLFDIHFPSS